MMYAVLGFLSGVISGMGIGGGVILIPALSFFTDWTQQQAQAANLLFFLPTACVALYKHKKEGNVQVDTAKQLVLWGLLGAAVGSFLAVGLDGTLLRRFFGGFLVVMGLLEIFQAKKKENK